MACAGSTESIFLILLSGDFVSGDIGILALHEFAIRGAAWTQLELCVDSCTRPEGGQASEGRQGVCRTLRGMQGVQGKGCAEWML